jgi:hypothetical protein
MFGFFFKKNLCDVWDNLFYVVVANFFFLIALFISYLLLVFLPDLFSSDGAKTVCLFFSLVISSVILCDVIFAAAENSARIANFNAPRYSAFFAGMKNSVKDAFFSGIFLSALIAVSAVSMPFYLSLANSAEGTLKFVYAAVLIVIFWFLFTTFLALQWFFAIKCLMKNSLKKCFRKCYIIFLDNIGFTFAVFFVNVLNLLLTLVTFGLYPGMNGIVITNTNALKILLYKYDWLEVNPGLSAAQRKNVPWDDLLAKDRKTLGPRTLKGFIFPWKEK